MEFEREYTFYHEKLRIIFEAADNYPNKILLGDFNTHIIPNPDEQEIYRIQSRLLAEVLE